MEGKQRLKHKNIQKNLYLKRGAQRPKARKCSNRMIKEDLPEQVILGCYGKENNGGLTGTEQYSVQAKGVTNPSIR